MSIPPVPYQTPMTDKSGLPSQPWAAWFRQILSTVLSPPAANITGVVQINQGGTGQITQQAALDAIAGAQSAGKVLRSDGAHTTLSAIQAADVPTLNQNTTGTAAGFSGSLAGDVTGTQSTTAVGKVNGLALPVSKTIVGTNASGQIVDASTTLLANDTTGVSANVTGLVAIANGGTGQTTANAALNNLLPTQTGKSGDFLTTDGTNTSWGSPASSGAPSGSVIGYAGTTAPTGWLSCDGSAVSRTTYSALFTAISTTYGAGDGSTTFNLPNAQGVFLRGAGSQTIGGIAHSGTQGTTQGDQMQGHWHNHDYGTGAGGGGGGLSQTGLVGHTGGEVKEAASDGTNGTPRVGSETRPANISVLWIIKT